MLSLDSAIQCHWKHHTIISSPLVLPIVVRLCRARQAGCAKGGGCLHGGLAGGRGSVERDDSYAKDIEKADADMKAVRGKYAGEQQNYRDRMLALHQYWTKNEEAKKAAKEKMEETKRHNIEVEKYMKPYYDARGGLATAQAEAVPEATAARTTSAQASMKNANTNAVVKPQQVAVAKQNAITKSSEAARKAAGGGGGKGVWEDIFNNKYNRQELQSAHAKIVKKAPYYEQAVTDPQGNVKMDRKVKNEETLLQEINEELQRRHTASKGGYNVGYTPPQPKAPPLVTLPQKNSEPIGNVDESQYFPKEFWGNNITKQIGNADGSIYYEFYDPKTGKTGKWTRKPDNTTQKAAQPKPQNVPLSPVDYNDIFEFK